MQISVVIATYNRVSLLARTLPTVMIQEIPPEEYEILVAVDGSIDGSIEYLRSLRPSCNLRVLDLPHRGQAAAINEALRSSCGRIVLFLDDDILCSPTLLGTHVSAHAQSPGRLVYGPVLLAPETPRGLAHDWARSFCDDFFAGVKDENEQEGWYRCMASANSSADRDLLLASGGLDETFSRGNDYEFGIRLWKSGRRFRFEPRAVVHQLFTKTVPQIVDEARDEGRATVRLARKYPEYRGSIAPVTGKRAGRFAILLELLRRACRQLRLLWFAEALHLVGFRALGLRLLRALMSLATLNGALDVVGPASELKREFGLRLPVLMYHNIGLAAPGSNPALTISPAEFRRQLRWLARRGYKSITASQWVAWCREATSLPDKPVLLTFDDAYSDTAKYGLPILLEEGFTGTVFVVSSEVGGTNTWDQANGVAKQGLMTADDILRWAEKGVEFGSHSQTHADLRHLTKLEVIAELGASRECLTRLLGQPIQSFAYPYGYYNDFVADRAEEEFSAAFTCDAGLNDLRTDLARLKRAEMTPFYSFLDPFFQVQIGYNPMIAARRELGRLRRQLMNKVRKAFRADECTAPSNVVKGLSSYQHSARKPF